MLLMGSFASGVSFILFGYITTAHNVHACVFTLFVHNTYSLVTMISADGGIFVAVCFVIRILLGAAVAMFSTAAFAMVTALYPDNIGLVMVRFCVNMSCAKILS